MPRAPNPVETASACRWSLAVEGPDGAEPERALEPGPYTIGRGEDCDLRLSGIDASRKHAVLERDDRGLLWLDDKGGPSGTFVNGTRIEGRVRLFDGDVVHVGSYRLEPRSDAPNRRRDQQVPAARVGRSPPPRVRVFESPGVFREVRLDRGVVRLDASAAAAIRLDPERFAGVRVVIKPRKEGGFDVVDESEVPSLLLDGRSRSHVVLQARPGDLTLQLRPAGGGGELLLLYIPSERKAGEQTPLGVSVEPAAPPADEGDGAAPPAAPVREVATFEWKVDRLRDQLAGVSTVRRAPPEGFRPPSSDAPTQPGLGSPALPRPPAEGPPSAEWSDGASAGPGRSGPVTEAGLGPPGPRALAARDTLRDLAPPSPLRDPTSPGFAPRPGRHASGYEPEGDTVRELVSAPTPAFDDTVPGGAFAAGSSSARIEVAVELGTPARAVARPAPAEAPTGFFDVTALRAELGAAAPPDAPPAPSDAVSAPAPAPERGAAAAAEPRRRPEATSLARSATGPDDASPGRRPGVTTQFPVGDRAATSPERPPTGRDDAVSGRRPGATSAPPVADRAGASPARPSAGPDLAGAGGRAGPRPGRDANPTVMLEVAAIETALARPPSNPGAEGSGARPTGGRDGAVPEGAGTAPVTSGTTAGGAGAAPVAADMAPARAGAPPEGAGPSLGAGGVPSEGGGEAPAGAATALGRLFGRRGSGPVAYLAALAFALLLAGLLARGVYGVWAAGGGAGAPPSATSALSTAGPATDATGGATAPTTPSAAPPPPVLAPEASGRSSASPPVAPAPSAGTRPTAPPTRPAPGSAPTRAPKPSAAGGAANAAALQRKQCLLQGGVDCTPSEPPP